jgi:flavorubredoxin
VSACGFDVLESFEVNYVPSESELAQYYEVGKQLASRVADSPA